MVWRLDLPTPLVGDPALLDDVVLVDSLSKTAWAGLRVGWLRAPVSLVPQLNAGLTTDDLAVPVLGQVLATVLFEQLDDICGPAARSCASAATRCSRWSPSTFRPALSSHLRAGRTCGGDCRE